MSAHENNFFRFAPRFVFFFEFTEVVQTQPAPFAFERPEHFIFR